MNASTQDTEFLCLQHISYTGRRHNSAVIAFGRNDFSSCFRLRSDLTGYTEEELEDIQNLTGTVWTIAQRSGPAAVHEYIHNVATPFRVVRVDQLRNDLNVAATLDCLEHSLLDCQKEPADCSGVHAAMLV